MVLTPQTRALSALVLAVTVILGSWSRGGYALNMLFLQSDARIAAIVGSLVPFAAAGLALVLAGSVLSAPSTDGEGTAGWEQHVAGAARLLAAAAILLTLLVLLGALVHEDGIYKTIY